MRLRVGAERHSHVVERLHDLWKISIEAEASKRFPSIEEVASGCSLYGGSLATDATAWSKLLHSREASNDDQIRFRNAVDLYATTQHIDACRALVRDFDKAAIDPDDHFRACVYAAATRADTTKAFALLKVFCDSDGLMSVWLAGFRASYLPQNGRMDCQWQKQCLLTGVHNQDLAKDALAVSLAVEDVHGEPLSSSANMKAFLRDLVASMNAENSDVIQELLLSEPSDDVAGGEEPESGGPSVPGRRITVLTATKTKTVAARSIWKTFEDIEGKGLTPRKLNPAFDPVRLYAEWPHATEVIARLLRGLAPKAQIRVRPTLLVGEPGCGKTSLFQAIGRALNLPTTVYSCGAVADNSFGGTPSRWASACPSLPLELIRQSKCPNPMVVLDEIEKSGSGAHNGDFHAAVLPMLERHTAAVYFEAGLDTTSDLSHVNFVATANTLDIPAPLRDRFHIIRMPNPGPQHIGELGRRILDDLARDRGETGLILPLAPDEIEVIRVAWNGGSLRKLKQAIEITLDTRDAVAVWQ